MMIFERIREIFLNITSLRRRRAEHDSYADMEDGGNQRPNPWTRDLERFNCYTREEAVDLHSKEMKMQLLIEQARLEKAKEALAQQQAQMQHQQQQQQLQAQQQRSTIGDGKTMPKVKRRTTDATLTDTKAWWGQAVATWDPEDAKNIGPQGQQRHPRQHKWFTQ